MRHFQARRLMTLGPEAYKTSASMSHGVASGPLEGVVATNRITLEDGGGIQLEDGSGSVEKEV